MEIKKSRLKQIIKEELDRYVSKVNKKNLKEGKDVADRIVTFLEHLEKDGDKN